MTSNLDDASDVHLGDHLGREEEGDYEIDDKGDVHKLGEHVKCLGGVHGDGDEREAGARSQHPPYPQFVHPFNVRVVVQVVVRSVVGQRQDVPSQALLAGEHADRS